MSNFDVYINGIQPDRAAEIQQIIEEMSKRLRINNQQAEKILNTPNTRISQSVSQEQAEKFQQTLQKIGVICLYRPSANTGGLSLEEIETKDDDVLRTCPNCDTAFPGNPDTPPDKCENCGVYIEKFLNNREDKEEKEEIRQQLLKKQSIRDTREQQIKDEQGEEIRKKVLEQAVLDEKEDPETKKKPNQTYILIGGSVLIVLLLVISFLFYGDNENLPIETADSSPDITNTEDTFQETEELATEMPVESESFQEVGELATEIPASSDTFQETEEMAMETSASPANTTLSQMGQSNPGIDGSKQGLQDAHEKASKVLGAFGLDPNAMANTNGSSPGASADIGDSTMGASTNSSGSSMEAGSDFGESTMGTSTNSSGSSMEAGSDFGDSTIGTIANRSITGTGTSPSINSPAALPNSHLNSSKILSTQSHENSSKAVSNNVLTPFLINYGVDDQEWNHFLTEKIEQLIANNNFDTANQIIPYLTKTERFIALSNRLLNSANESGLKKEIIANIKTKIYSSPLELQAQYFSQAAQYQENIKRSEFLFNQAENAWKTISDPKKQLSSALQIGVSYYKSGNIDSANRFFKKINLLLPKITTTENQINSRATISRAFYDIGQKQIAFNWLNSTDKFIDNANKSSLQRIIESYAYINQLNKAVTLAKQAPSTDTQGELLYSAIKASLDSGLNNNVTRLINIIQDPTTRALSYTILTSYLEDDLASAEILLQQSINGTSNKAIVSSRIAQLYARQKNSIEADKLFQQTEQLIKTIPSSAEKDKLLEIVTTNYSYNQKSTILLSYYQSSSTKLNRYKKIKQLSEVYALLDIQ